MIELIAVVFSLLSVVLTIRKSIWCWPTGIVGIIAFFILFLDERLYADTCLQTIMLIQSLYGWWYWLHGGMNKASAKVTSLSIAQQIAYSVLIIMAWILISIFFKSYTNASLPFFDSAVTTLSLFANWLLAKKKIENWYLWIVADVGYVVLFSYKHLYLSALTYFIFLILAIYGFILWRKNLRR